MEAPSIAFPRPGKAVLGVMIAMFAIWVGLAVAINWAGVSPAIMDPFVGDTQEVLHGQIWRLATAAMLHLVSGEGAVSHIVMTLLGLYFLAPTLEDRWGPKRMLLFLLGSAVFSYACQVIVGSLIRQLYQGTWLGALGVVDAIAVAWALHARPGSQVRLMFILPVSPMMLLAFIFGMNVLRVIAVGANLEGLVTPFGGMAAGYLLGDTSPLRRLYLKFKLQRLQAETASIQKKRRAAASGFKVIQGGGEPPKDKRFLN